MSDYLLSVPTVLRPTTTQTNDLERLKCQAADLHLWLRQWLRLRGAGVRLPVAEALNLSALPQVADHQRVQVAHSALAELATSEAAALLNERWSALPAATIKAIICANTARLRSRSPQPARKLLPLLPLTAVPFDRAVTPVDDYRVLLEGLPDPLVCDLWALPTSLFTALLIEAGEHAQESQRKYQATLTDLLAGDAGGLHKLYPHAAAIIARQTTDRFPKWCGQRPHRASYASLTITTEPSGEVVPVINWSIRIPAKYLRPAQIDDTIGADLGIRNLITLADKERTWRVSRRAHVRQLPPPDPASAAQMLLHAQARRAVLEAARPELEATLAKVLTYRRANIEALSYHGMRDHGRVPWAPEAMALSGAAAWPIWVELLAPLTGTQVRRIDPAGTSTTCPKCARPCERPKPFDLIVCPHHGTMDADEAAAQMIRRG